MNPLILKVSDRDRKDCPIAAGANLALNRYGVYACSQRITVDGHALTEADELSIQPDANGRTRVRIRRKRSGETIADWTQDGYPRGTSEAAQTLTYEGALEIAYDGTHAVEVDLTDYFEPKTIKTSQGE